MRWNFEVAGAKEKQAGATPVEERALIERAQRGDPDAFRALLERYQRRVFSLIGNLIRRPAEVEDIAQQVFLKLYLALPRFDFRAAFSTWLYRIVVNECYDQWRRHGALKRPRDTEIPLEEGADWDRLSARASRPEDDVARRTELRQLLERLFQRLPGDDRLLLSLKELEGFSVEEIAALVGMKENTVKVRLFRARQRLVEVHRRFLSRH